MRYARFTFIVTFIITFFLQHPLGAVDSFAEQQAKQKQKIRNRHLAIAIPLDTIATGSIAAANFLPAYKEAFSVMAAAVVVVQGVAHAFLKRHHSWIDPISPIVPSENPKKTLYLQGDIASILKAAGKKYAKKNPRLSQELQARYIGALCFNKITNNNKYLSLYDKRGELNEYFSTFEITPQEAATLLNNVPIDRYGDSPKKDAIFLFKENAVITALLPPSLKYPHNQNIV